MFKHPKAPRRRVVIPESEEEDLDHIVEQEVREGDPERPPYKDYEDGQEESQKSYISISSESSSSSSN